MATQGEGGETPLNLPLFQTEDLSNLGSWAEIMEEEQNKIHAKHSPSPEPEKKVVEYVTMLENLCPEATEEELYFFLGADGVSIIEISGCKARVEFTDVAALDRALRLNGEKFRSQSIRGENLNLHPQSPSSRYNPQLSSPRSHQQHSYSNYHSRTEYSNHHKTDYSNHHKLEYNNHFKADSSYNSYNKNDSYGGYSSSNNYRGNFNSLPRGRQDGPRRGRNDRGDFQSRRGGYSGPPKEYAYQGGGGGYSSQGGGYGPNRRGGPSQFYSGGPLPKSESFSNYHENRNAPAPINSRSRTESSSSSQQGGRRHLNLLSRTESMQSSESFHPHQSTDSLHQPIPIKKPSKKDIFGDALPVDTSKREREVEEKLEKQKREERERLRLERDKKEKEEKEERERRDNEKFVNHYQQSHQPHYQIVPRPNQGESSQLPPTLCSASEKEKLPSLMGQQIESPPPPVDPEQRKDGEGGAYRGRGGGAIGETAHKKPQHSYPRTIYRSLTTSDVDAAVRGGRGRGGRGKRGRMGRGGERKASFTGTEQSFSSESQFPPNSAPYQHGTSGQPLQYKSRPPQAPVTVTQKEERGEDKREQPPSERESGKREHHREEREAVRREPFRPETQFKDGNKKENNSSESSKSKMRKASQEKNALGTSNAVAKKEEKAEEKKKQEKPKEEPKKKEAKPPTPRKSKNKPDKTRFASNNKFEALDEFFE